MSYEQFISAYEAGPDASTGLLALGVAVVLGFITAHLTSKALRTGGKFRRWFVATSSGILVFVVAGAVLFGLVQTLARQPLVQENPEYAERYLEQLRQQGDARVAAAEADRRVTSHDPVDGCAELYDLRPGQYGTTRGLNGGDADAVSPRYPNGESMFPGRRVWVVALAAPGGHVMLTPSGSVTRESDEPLAYCMIEYDERWRQWRDVSDPAGYRLNQQ